MEKRARPFAKKSLGQNFLVDRNVVSKIVGALGLRESDRVMEIGPGPGALTGELSEKCRELILVEKDDRFASELAERFAERNVTVLHADLLELDLDVVMSDQIFKVVGNLPYNVGTAIVQKISEKRYLVELAVFMLQREVVDRMVAEESSSDRGFLSVICQYSFKVEKLFDVPPGAFRPSPKVTSSVVRLTPRHPHPAPHFEATFRAIVSDGFSQRRKTLLNNLKSGSRYRKEALERCLSDLGIEKDRRAESLSVHDWISLTEALGPF